jgi:hypothetical protein
VAQKALAFPEDFRPRMETADQQGGFHFMSDEQTRDNQTQPRKTISFTSTTNTSGQVGHQQRWTKWFMPGQLGARPVPTKRSAAGGTWTNSGTQDGTQNPATDESRRFPKGHHQRSRLGHRRRFNPVPPPN